jgi:ubiquinone/menaquinone biosynthesis C-methylase UbiE
MDASMVQYYSRRAAEYEEIWHRPDPIRQAEQSAMAAALKECFRGRRVLEVACGTGYWTACAAEVAEQICAVDASAQMLELARAKQLSPERVEFRQGDAYALETIPGDFNAGLANFWFSHVPKARVPDFLCGFHRRIGPGARVFMADNVFVPGVGGELVARPGVADTFKLRQLADGSRHEVLKNYYEPGQLRELLAPLSKELHIESRSCFWCVNYCVA